MPSTSPFEFRPRLPVDDVAELLVVLTQARRVIERIDRGKVDQKAAHTIDAMDQAVRDGLDACAEAAEILTAEALIQSGT